MIIPNDKEIITSKEKFLEELKEEESRVVDCVRYGFGAICIDEDNVPIIDIFDDEVEDPNSKTVTAIFRISGNIYRIDKEFESKGVGDLLDS